MKMKSRIHKFHSWKYTPSEYLIGPPGGLYKDVIFKLFVVAGRQGEAILVSPKKMVKKNHCKCTIWSTMEKF